MGYFVLEKSSSSVFSSPDLSTALPVLIQMTDTIKRLAHTSIAPTKLTGKKPKCSDTRLPINAPPPMPTLKIPE